MPAASAKDSPQQGPSSSLACLIKVAARDVTNATTRLLRPFGVTPAQAEVLYYLRAGETSPSKIAESIGVDASNLTRIVTAFEKRGLARRDFDPENRARITIGLTPAGKKLAGEIDFHAEDIQSAMLAALSDRDQAAIRRALAKVSDAMNAVAVEEEAATRA